MEKRKIPAVDAGAGTGRLFEPDSPCAKLLSFSFSLMLLLSLELVARIVPAPAERIDEILAILRQDPALFWKVREHIDVRFQGKQVTTNAQGLRNAEIPAKRTGDLRVVCLGESLTFGWGVDETEAYPAVLEGLLGRQMPGVEVINAGQVGYSSLQGLRFFERVVVPLAPDVITVPYVINDVDRFRFFRSDGRSDGELRPGNAALIRVEDILRHSALARRLAKAARGLRGHGDRYAPGAVRVSEEEYARNLREIVHAARAKGIAVVFLKMPVNLPSMPALPERDKARSRELLARGQALLQARDYAAAVRTLENAAELNPYDGAIHAALGTAYGKSGAAAMARRSRARAKDCETYRCRERGDRYNRIMERVSRSENVPLVDVVSLFSRYSAARGAYLFNDPKNDCIHPNPRGHALIAAALAEVIGAGRHQREERE